MNFHLESGKEIPKMGIIPQMKLNFAMNSRLLTVFAALGLASCSLPPEAAWHVVKTDGLIPLIAMEMGTRPYPPNLAAYNHPKPEHNDYLATPADRVPQRIPEPAPPAMVRVDPPKPIPQRPDSPVVNHHDEEVAAGMETRPRPPRPNLITKKHSDASSSEVAQKEPEHAPAVIATPRPRPESQPEPEKKPTPSVASNAAPSQPAPARQISPAAQPPAKTQEEGLPYGIAIPGRPGLVNSPYAAKNQFVDVAGLKPGQEVKCPYSGKLFRVPVGAQASSNAKPGAAPEKDDDKKQ